MAHVREVNRKGGIAYEARWKVNGKFKQRTFTVRREAERFARDCLNNGVWGPA